MRRHGRAGAGRVARKRSTVAAQRSRAASLDSGVGSPTWVATSDAVPSSSGSLVTTTEEPSAAVTRHVVRRSVPLTLGVPTTTPCTVPSAAADAVHLSISSAVPSAVELLTLVRQVPSER